MKKFITLTLIGVIHCAPLFITSCETPVSKIGAVEDVGCIQPPITLTEASKKSAFEATAKQLETLQIDASLKINFERTVKRQWGTLNDDNAALYLFLKAIECFGEKQNPFFQTVAQDLLKIVRDRYASEKGISSFTRKFSPIEAGQIRNSKYSDSLVPLAQRLGLL